ncbi:MAG: aldo/keto reductase [Clostridiales bacterium]|nr:aldo/keto reductase [Clostridiales bacterium]
MKSKPINLVLGTMTFGESVFQPQVGEFINAFLDAGYDELDTAYVYNEGNCERFLGEVLPGINRPFKIATKVNPRISGRLDADAAYKQVSESLERMRLDSVDTVFLHFPDPATPVESVLGAMADLHDRGKYRELGLSNFPAWMVADVWHICDRHGWVRPTVYEGVYNPLTRGAETELNDCINNYGLRFYAYNPTMGGLLTGKYKSVNEAPADGRFTHRPGYQDKYWNKTNFDAIQVIREATEQCGMTMVEATYRWLAYHSMLDGDRGDSILIGASKLNHLISNMETVKAGPLPETVTDAFSHAWEIARGSSRVYFTLYKGKGSVGGEKK